MLNMENEHMTPKNPCALSCSLAKK